MLYISRYTQYTSKNINKITKNWKKFFNFSHLEQSAWYSVDKKEKRGVNNMSNSYIMELRFYLSIILYDKYLRDDIILLDLYYDSINKIMADYLKHDNNNKALIESINDYIEERKDFILETLNECIEI